MTKRLPHLAYFCIALALAASAPFGTLGAQEVALSKQLSWCLEAPSPMARDSVQDGADLEPHHAAVLAACAEQAAREEPSSNRFALETASMDR